MYQPSAPIVQFSQAPAQPAPIVQIMPQPQMPTYPQPAPMMMAAPAPDTKKDEGREAYRPNSGSGRCLKIFVIVGIVGAALVACIIVGVVVGVLMTTKTGIPRTPCEEIAEKTIGALPYRFTNVSQNDCVYGYYSDDVCMYDGHFDADGGSCHGKDYGADLIAGGCYYNGESTCHCSMAYREDENRCYSFAINFTNTKCTNGLITRDYCLYEKRKTTNRRECSSGWDEVENYCYVRKKTMCDKFRDDGIARKNCLKGISFVRKRYN